MRGCNTTPSGWLPRRIRLDVEKVWVTQRALSFDNDHVWVLSVERLDDDSFHLTRTELRRNGIERDTVAGTLNQAGLASAHQHRLQAVSVERAGQDVGRRALADGAVGTEHGDPGASNFSNATSEYP